METVKIARYRSTPYKVNYKVNGGGIRPFKWEGSKNKRNHTLDIPLEVVEWLLYSTVAFKNGELVIVEDNETTKMLTDYSDINNNTHSREDIEKLLNGKINVLKEELSKIIDEGEKRFVLSVVREVKPDSAAKMKAISEWAGIPSFAIIDEEE